MRNVEQPDLGIIDAVGTYAVRWHAMGCAMSHGGRQRKAAVAFRHLKGVLKQI